MQPDAALAHGEIAEFDAHAVCAWGTDGHSPDARALGRCLPPSAGEGMRSEGALDAGPFEPGLWPDQARGFGLAERSENELPRLAQTEPHARRPSFDA